MDTTGPPVGTDDGIDTGVDTSEDGRTGGVDEAGAALLCAWLNVNAATTFIEV